MDPAAVAFVSERLADGRRLRHERRLLDATAELERALELARSSPYDVTYELWTRLLLELSDVQVLSGRADQARALLAQDAPFLSRINDLMQSTGTPEQKRQAAGGWMMVRDRQAQLELAGRPAPELGETTWVLGEPTTLAAQRGKVVLLEFWATWCTPCIEAFQDLNALQRQHGTRGLSVIAVTRLYSSFAQGPAEQASEIATTRNFVTGRDLTFPVGILRDDQTHQRYGASGLPTVILVDRLGNVRSAHHGARDPEVQDLLQECLGA